MPPDITGCHPLQSPFRRSRIRRSPPAPSIRSHTQRPQRRAQGTSLPPPPALAATASRIRQRSSDPKFLDTQTRNKPSPFLNPPVTPKAYVNTKRSEEH